MGGRGRGGGAVVLQLYWNTEWRNAVEMVRWCSLPASRRVVMYIQLSSTYNPCSGFYGCLGGGWWWIIIKVGYIVHYCGLIARYINSINLLRGLKLYSRSTFQLTYYLSDQ